MTVPRAPHDQNASKHVRTYLERVSAAFQNALANGQASGYLADSVDIEAEARFFTSHALGQLMLIRSNVAPEFVESAYVIALEHLRSLENVPELGPQNADTR